MKLRIATPGAVVVEADGIASVVAEDETGAFGVRPGHADFVTALAVSVVAWRTTGGGESYCAVRGGLLTVNGGTEIAVATREAVLGQDLAELEGVVRERLLSDAEAERQARTHAERLRIQAIREMIGFLRPNAGAGPGGAG
jgi:F-type H+-transporting ATPase subunit epsilon